MLFGRTEVRGLAQLHDKIESGRQGQCKSQDLEGFPWFFPKIQSYDAEYSQSNELVGHDELVNSGINLSEVHKLNVGCCQAVVGWIPGPGQDLGLNTMLLYRLAMASTVHDGS